MIVLSLFDGMGCGYEALKRAGIYVTKYYASEIDKFAMKIAKKNHPDIIHLGDVNGWEDWDIERPDLIIGGSPCQGFSFAGRQLAFDDPRSKLFFTMTDIIDYYKPRLKFLENVKMKQEFLDVITDFMNCGDPHFINSALVSAQNRQRYYWYNWDAPDPEDRGLLLKDIMEDDGKPLSENEINYMNRKTKDGRTHWDFGHHSDVRNDKSSAIVANFSKGVPYNVIQVNPSLECGGKQPYMQNRIYHPEGKSVAVTAAFGNRINVLKPIKIGELNEGGIGDRIYSPEGKSICLTAKSGGTASTGNMLVATQRKRGLEGVAITENGIRPYKNDGRKGSFSEIGTIATPDNKVCAVTASHTPKITGARIVGRYIDPQTGKRRDYAGKTEQRLEVRKDGKAGCLTSVQKDSVLSDGFSWRKLTCVECERLQTLRDGYTEGVSDTQRYKMIGNGWTVEAIVHLFSYMPLNELERMQKL